MDVDFVNDDFVYRPYAGKPSRCRWSHVLVPGELKSNPMADAPPPAWIDLATYARKALSAQDTLRLGLFAAHLEDDPQTAFAIKGSWQYPERDDEGEILRQITQQGMINVAGYYHHETVCIRDANDDIRDSVRTGLDIAAAAAAAATADGVTTPDSTATTVMADAIVIVIAGSTV
ncbi:hypothetical protein J3E68DRAFT_429348 [Trichoderma sp. SZMC 28012]